MEITKCTDDDWMITLLGQEGFPINRTGIHSCANVKTDYGFFSVRLEHGYPRLVHFIVEKEKRNFSNSLDQFNAFTELMILVGYPSFIVEVPREKPELEKAIQFIGGKKPYQVIDGDKVYLIQTGYRRKKHHGR
jgi:hypothetical protein